MSRPSWKKLVLGTVGGGVLAVVALGGVAYALTAVPSASSAATAQSLRVLYSDGTLLARGPGSNRVLVPLSAVSLDAQHAVLAAEDRGFYSEPGISPKGIARALFTNVKGGGVQQGGSTITQQYAKNAFLTSQRTYTRKVKEVLIALKMTQTRSKEQILSDYLNTIYFGRGAYGIEAATKAYFGGSAKDLSVAQAAVLASSVRSPSGYDPATHPKAAQDRWAYVLDGMVQKGWLTPAQRAQQQYPTVRDPSKSAPDGCTGWKSYVCARVRQELGADGFAADEVENGGLVAQTTLRRSAQDAAVTAVEQRVSASGDRTKPTAALVSVVPGTGEVYAYVGGLFGRGGVDFAHDDKRQPGSSFKPFVLATALQQGISLGRSYPAYSPQDICGTSITNDEGDPYLSSADLVTATSLSVNTVYFRLACDVGPQKVADTAHAAGIPADTPLYDVAHGETTPAAGIALGQYDVRVLDQADAYATFAAGGVHAAPFFVKTVRRGSTRVYTAKARTTRAFGSDVAADVTYALRQVVRNGTGTRASLPDRPVAGKTGTTSNNVDAWFVGYTPQLATAVWVGRPDRQPLAGVLGVSGGVYGGTVPAELFAQYQEAALQGQPVQDLPPRAYVGSSSGSGGGSGGGRGGYLPSGPRQYVPPPVGTAAPLQSAPPSSVPSPVQTPAAPPQRPVSSPRPVATQAPPSQQQASPPPAQQAPPPPAESPAPAPS